MAVNRAIPNLPPGLVNDLLFFAVVVAGVGYIIVSKLNGFGALASAIFDIAGNAGKLFVGHPRAHFGQWVEAGSDFDLAGNFGNAGDHAIVDRFVGVKA